MHSFCSDVAVQNVNVISSPTYKVLWFKKHHRVSPIKCFMLETYPYAVRPSAKVPALPSLSILSPPSSSSILASPSSPSLSSSPLSLNLTSSSSSSFSGLFYISSTSDIRVSPSYLNSSVLFNYLFFIICYWLQI